MSLEPTRRSTRAVGWRMDSTRMAIQRLPSRISLQSVIAVTQLTSSLLLLERNSKEMVQTMMVWKWDVAFPPKSDAHGLAHRGRALMQEGVRPGAHPL